MELKVFKDALAAYGGRWETKLELPVETELLIPDYLPAVFKIVKCLVEPVLMQNHITGTRWQGEGYLRCTVYYQSDEEDTQLCRAEQKFPFEKQAELPEGTYMQGPAQVWGEAEYVNCRAVSEHRIDLRGAYVLQLFTERLDQLELLTSLAECGIEQRTEKVNGCICVASDEKIFTAEGNVPLPGAGESILEISGSFDRQEANVQAGQVNCRGTLRMQVCYRPGGGGNISCQNAELPVRQTVELDAAAEGDMLTLWGEVLTSTLTAGTDALQTTLSVTWKLHIELWRAVERTVVADAYSTLCETKTTRAQWQLLHRADALSETIHAEISDTLPLEMQEVKGCFVSLQAPRPEVGENPDTVVLRGKGTAHVICADERGELSCCDKAFAWQSAGSWPGAAETYLQHLCATMLSVHSQKDGASFKVTADIGLAGTLFQTQSEDTVSEVELGELFEDKNEGPALYLYYPMAGETVFDIAKRYHARAKDLAAANHLEPQAGQAVSDMKADAACLLIPTAL